VQETSTRPAATYLRALRAHRLLALAVLAITVAASIAYLQLRDERYQATAEVLVTPLSVDQQATLGLPLITESADSTRVSQTAAALLRNNSAATVAAVEMGDGWDRNRVLGAIQIQPRGESNVIALTSTADSPSLAAKLANEYTRATLAVQNEALRRRLSLLIDSLQEELDSGLSGGEQSGLESRIAALRVIDRTGDPTLSLVQRAVEPDNSSSPPSALVLAAALLGGAILAFGAALIAASLDRRVRDEDELVTLLQAPILARIPPSSRRSARARAAEAYRTLAAEIEESGGARQVVMVTGGSSGDGKTHCAAELASAAREAGQEVIFLDFDVHRTTDSRHHLNGDLNRGHLFGLWRDDPALPRLDPRKPLSDVLIYPSSDPGFKVGLAPSSQHQTELASLSRQMSRLIAEARRGGSLVVIDTPPLGEIGDALRLVAHVDLILVVAQLGVSRRAGLESLRDLLDRVGETSAGLVVLGDPSPAAG
jgi:Mrp family chromosome partitioning ATPase